MVGVSLCKNLANRCNFIICQKSKTWSYKNMLRATIICFREKVLLMDRSPFGAPPKVLVTSLLRYLVIWIDYDHRVYTAGAPPKKESMGHSPKRWSRYYYVLRWLWIIIKYGQQVQFLEKKQEDTPSKCW